MFIKQIYYNGRSSYQTKFSALTLAEDAESTQKFSYCMWQLASDPEENSS